MMKNTLLLILAILLVNACSSPKPVQEVSKDISGTWTMTHYSAFMPDIPKLQEGDIIWAIDLAKHTVTVTKKHPKKHAFMGAKEGVHFSAKNDHIINVDETNYFYSVRDEKLILDSNIDPRISKDGPVISFKKYQTE